MKNSRKGVTLIELVLTIALVGLVLQVIYSIFFVGNTSYSISTNRGFSQQDVRLVGDFITSELKYITEITTSDDYVDDYYSIRVDEVDGRKVLTKTLHEYMGDGTEENKDSVTDKTIVRKIVGNWDNLTITNNILGEIDILISQEEGVGNQKSGYELPLKIPTINNNELLINLVDLDLLNGGVLYYRNNSANLLTRGIDINSTDDESTGPFKINFYSDTEEIIPYHTITGLAGTPLVLPAVPSKEDYTFIRWNPTVPDNMPNTNLDIYAVWESTIIPAPVSILTNLNIVSVIDQNGTVASINGVYNVKKSKQVTIKLSFQYNKPPNNLEIIVSGFSGSISETGNTATLKGTAPGKNVTQNINIEIREKLDYTKKVSINMTLKGIN